MAQDREPDKALEVLACAKRLAAQNAQTAVSRGAKAEDVPLSQFRNQDALELAEWFIRCCRGDPGHGYPANDLRQPSYECCFPRCRREFSGVVAVCT